MWKKYVNCFVKFKIFLLSLSSKILPDLDPELQLFNEKDVCDMITFAAFRIDIIFQLVNVLVRLCEILLKKI